ncbi:MAG: hypothetical protein WC785_03415 [Tatlockia sp.]|jgi:hypothetical protein
MHFIFQRLILAETQNAQYFRNYWQEREVPERQQLSIREQHSLISFGVTPNAPGRIV